MKRIATLLFLVIFLTPLMASATQSNAGVTSNGVEVLKPSKEKAKKGTVPFVNTKGIKHPSFTNPKSSQTPQELPYDQTLGYYSPEMDEAGAWLSWMLPDTTQDQDANEYQVREYGERFSTELAQPTLDSMQFRFGAIAIDQTAGKSIKVAIRPQMNREIDPVNNPGYMPPFPDPDRRIGSQVTIPAEDIVLDDPEVEGLELNAYTVKFGTGGKGQTLKIGTKWYPNFYIMVNVGDSSTTNEIALISDQWTADEKGSTDFDTNTDRSYFIQYRFDDLKGYWSTAPLAGRYNLTSSGSVLYPNFIMVAYLHDASLSDVQDYSDAKGNGLAQNFPNPFNPSTVIKYSVANAGNATLKVYNALGSEVATLVDGFVTTGEHEANFDASGIPTGTYYYTLKSGDFTQTKRMVLSK